MNIGLFKVVIMKICWLSRGVIVVGYEFDVLCVKLVIGCVYWKCYGVFGGGGATAVSAETDYPYFLTIYPYCIKLSDNLLFGRICWDVWLSQNKLYKYVLLSLLYCYIFNNFKFLKYPPLFLKLWITMWITF